MNKKNEPFMFFRWRWLKGIDEISQHTGFEISDLMDMVAHYDDCPLSKLESEGIWICKKRELKKFIKEKSPPRTEIIEVSYIEPRKTFKRRKKW